MRCTKLMLISLVIIGLLSPNVFAGSCTKDEVEKAVKYAANLINTKGQAAVAELEAYRYCGGEGYVFITDMQGLSVMHPILHNTGQDTTRLQGAKGEYFGMEMKVKAEQNGEGWIAYTWQNPKTKALENKCAYVKAATMGGKKVFAGSGVYGIGPELCK